MPDDMTCKQGAAMDKEEIKKLAVGLVSGDRKLQYKLIDEYCTDDVEFVHTLFRTRGKEAYKAIYRWATTVMDYKIDFVDIISEADRMALWVILKVKMAPFYLFRYHFPTIVLVYFRQDPATGRKRICKQVDHHSAYVVTWLFGWPTIMLSEMVLRPLAGKIFVTLGTVVDAVADAKEAARGMLHSLLGIGSLPVCLDSGRADGPAARRIIDIDATK